MAQMNKVNGTPALTPEEAGKFFIIDAEKAITIMENFLKADNKETKIDILEITAHGMKSALGNIGEKEQSVIAYKLENAAKERDFNLLENEIPIFIYTLKSLIQKQSLKNKVNIENITEEDKIYLKNKFTEIKTACKKFNANNINIILEELSRKTWPEKIDDFIDEINVNLLHSAYRKAAVIVNNAINWLDQ